MYAIYYIDFKSTHDKDIYVRVLSIFLLITSTLLLQGCVAIPIFVGTAAIYTKSTMDSRSIGTQIDDSILALRIKRALSQDNNINQRTRIRSIVYKNKVLLVGQSPNIQLILRVIRTIKSIRKNNKIYNYIRRNYPIHFRNYLLDEWITMKIRFKLIIYNYTIFSNLKITTENNEVFVLGTMTKKEMQKVINIINLTNGVKNVISIISYIRYM